MSKADIRIQRERQADLDDAIDASQQFPADCSAAMVATTTTVTSYPTTPSAYYAVSPTDIGGNEVEGGAATYTTSSAVAYALNVGSQTPPNGTRVVCHAVGGRWVFRYDG